jgi:hypothetical protein
MPELLQSYKNCSLCTFVVSVRGMYIGPHDPENPLRPLKEYDEIFTEFPDRVIGLLTDGKPIEAYSHVDVKCKVSSMRFIFEFNQTRAWIGLAVWLGEPWKFEKLW